VTIDIENMPDSSYVRQPDLVGRRPVPARGSKPARPGERGVVAFSAATLWRKVKARTFPEPVPISAGLVGWRVKDIRAWMADPMGWKPDDPSAI
jgi:prophage regulatory protein